MDKNQLAKLKLKAKRAGLWFKALPRIDRVLIDLTIMVATRIRSTTLAENLLDVVRKLEAVLENTHQRISTIAGFELARKLSLVAQEWGNAAAKQWAESSSFAFFLAVMSISKPKTFKT